MCCCLKGPLILHASCALTWCKRYNSHDRLQVQLCVLCRPNRSCSMYLVGLHKCFRASYDNLLGNLSCCPKTALLKSATSASCVSQLPLGMTNPYATELYMAKKTEKRALSNIQDNSGMACCADISLLHACLASKAPQVSSTRPHRGPLPRMQPLFPTKRHWPSPSVSSAPAHMT